MTPEEKHQISDQQLKSLEDALRKAASELFADGALKPAEYTFPVLGLIFLKYADEIFQDTKVKLESKRKPNRFWKLEELTKVDFHSKWVVYVPEKASYEFLLQQPEGVDYGKLLNKAMELIEKENPEKLEGVLPKEYTWLSNSNIIKLLKTFSELDKIDGDSFGLIYEYFMGKFELEGGQKGWEFFTPRSIVKLIVNIIEPYKGKIFDPACGSGGMFTQSLQYIKDHKKENIAGAISVYGQEIKTQTIKLAKMNLAINWLEGNIKEWNSLYQDEFDSIGKFDFVMANPPFNVSGIDKSKIAHDPRYSFGIPNNDNANYLWIQIFASALSKKGRAGFVMANSASDAGNTELEIRKKMIDAWLVDVIVSIWPKFFYTVTLPCTLWFLDRSKKWTDREWKLLFIDAKEIYRQIDKAHREFTEDQIGQIVDIVMAYRWEKWTYEDVKGLCRVCTIEEIQANWYSLNPGRYVWVIEGEVSKYDFLERIHSLTKQFEKLTQEAHKLEKQIIDNAQKIKK